MRYTSTSEIGLVRKENQDALLVMENKNALLALVCDGIGGAQGGEIASATVIKIFQEAFIAIAAFEDFKDVQMWFKQTLQKANSTVYKLAKESNYQGMGTTLAACIILNDSAIGFNIGDSRIYRLYKNSLTCLSQDQTYAYEMYLRHEISFSELRNHPKRNILINAVGIGEEVEYESIAIAKDWDLLLLSSDGLHDYVEDEQIEIALQEKQLMQKRQELIRLAYEAGGYDNVSVIIVEGDTK